VSITLFRCNTPAIKVLAAAAYSNIVNFFTILINKSIINYKKEICEIISKRAYPKLIFTIIFNIKNLVYTNCDLPYNYYYFQALNIILYLIH
jgi:hypothetical protein